MTSLFSVKPRKSTYSTKKKSLNGYKKQNSSSNYRSVVSSKKHIQYLGNLISDEGIQPLPEKLESIAKMPVPQNAKQVKQFFRTCRLLQKICTTLLKHSKATHTAHPKK